MGRRGRGRERSEDNLQEGSHFGEGRGRGERERSEENLQALVRSHFSPPPVEVTDSGNMLLLNKPSCGTFAVFVCLLGDGGLTVTQAGLKPMSILLP